MLHADDRMTVTFQVGDREFGGSGNLDLDFWVSGIACRSEGRGLEIELGQEQDGHWTEDRWCWTEVMDKIQAWAALHETILRH